MRMLYINIVATRYPNEGMVLGDNESLLRHLDEIISGTDSIRVNVLFNSERGNDTYEEYYMKLMTRFLHGKVVIIRTDELLSLGEARDTLRDYCDQGPFYINVDEDDDIDVSSLIHLSENLDELNPYRLTMFGFKWYFERDGELMYKVNPYIEDELFTEDCNLPIKVRSLRGVCSWNYVHSTWIDKNYGLKRPHVSKYDDCYYYNTLFSYQELRDIDFLPLIIYEYHSERARVSKNKDEYLNTVTDYLTSFHHPVVGRVIEI